MCASTQDVVSSEEWSLSVHSECGKPIRQAPSGIRAPVGHEEDEISPSVLAKIKCRITEPVEWVQMTTKELGAAPNLANRRHQSTSNRLSLPLSDSVWLRYYRDHPQEQLAPEHQHLRDAVESIRQPPSA